MQIIVLDKHPLHDGRIERHIKYLLSQKYPVYRIHFNRSDPSLSSGSFSQFGEMGYRINAYERFLLLNNKSLYFNIFCFTPLITIAAKNAIKHLKINITIPTILHVHDPTFLKLAVKLKKSFFINAKIVYDRHEIYEVKTSIFGLNIPKIARLHEIITKNQIDGVISVSEDHNAVIQKFFPMSLVSTVPNYPNISDYKREIVFQKINNFTNTSKINFIYVGSLANNYDRDIDLLLKIAEATLHTYSNAYFYLGGSCNDPILVEKFFKLHQVFGDRFTYLGRISQEQIARLTEKSHIGFFLLRPETKYWVRASPNKVFEYLVCGTIPLIRADVIHSQDLTTCSLIFSKETPKEVIIKEVFDLIDNPDKIRFMMEKAVDVSKKFIFGLVCKRYINTYERLFYRC